ncbi:Miro domain protein [Thermovirga lienii DSM 17291]|uniref:Miro domain protein n=1 Tax=Thermovirga lienii (strain ATCC BAA-1197 / DSM 17291 / Cas60314) TaxID=580340 RepID=G7V6A8_THELD|nr:EutP/PduV family microcompartment system protein [Thermovirga lienii]AER65937.1 Miro domain protein [Thermovirga lienii DSM 17291]
MTRRVMVVGRTGVGKTTLLEKLGLLNSAVKKTESVEFAPQFIDTPGEFMEMSRFYHALITSSTKADVVLLVVDASNPGQLPPGISKAFAAPVLGCVNKIDLLCGDCEEKVDNARKKLLEAGVEEVYAVSAKEGIGVRELKEKIEEILWRCA